MPQCPCYCYDSLGQTVPQGGCCGNSMGSYGNPLHPLCNGKTCNNLNYGNASHGCWDSNPAWGSVVPGGTPNDDPIEFMPDYDLEIDRTDLKTDIDREKNIDKEKYLSRKIKEMKKSKLRKIIKESIKELMKEQTNLCSDPTFLSQIHDYCKNQMLPPNINWPNMTNFACTGGNTFESLFYQKQSQAQTISTQNNIPATTHGPANSWNGISSWVNSQGIAQPQKGQLKRKYAKMRWALCAIQNCNC